MNAATLMNSGTVTKNPAMKLRRSHCIDGHCTQRGGDRGEAARCPRAMRYHANGTKPTRRTNARNGRDHERRRDERHDEADADFQRTPAPRWWRTSSRLVRERRRHRRHREKERELRGRRRGPDPSSMPPTMVAPERDTPGNHREHLAGADARARAAIGVRSASSTVGTGRNRSTTSITIPPSDEGDRKHRRALVENAIHVIGEQRAGEDRGQERDERSSGRNASHRDRTAGPRRSRMILAR